MRQALNPPKKAILYILIPLEEYGQPKWSTPFDIPRLRSKENLMTNLFILFNASIYILDFLYFFLMK